jgi:hypothetical protein
LRNVGNAVLQNILDWASSVRRLLSAPPKLSVPLIRVFSITGEKVIGLKHAISTVRLYVPKQPKLSLIYSSSSRVAE